MTVNIIEKTLESYGIFVRIKEVNYRNYDIEYCIDAALGTNSDKIIKHKRDLAIAVASPTGAITIKAPIPGRSLIGIYVPLPQLKKEDLDLKLPEATVLNWIKNPIRSSIGQWLLNLSYTLYRLALTVGKINP